MCATAVWILLVLVFFVGLAYLGRNKMPFCPPCRPLQLLHNLRSPPKTTAFQVKETDSVDERLDRLAEALADKESRCYLSKSKILSTKHEMSQLCDGSKQQYQSILEGLRKELGAAEVECRRIQQQIEWVSQRRTELNDEIQLGHRMYGRAATELASNLTDLQQGRPLCRPASYQGGYQLHWRIPLWTSMLRNPWNSTWTSRLPLVFWGGQNCYLFILLLQNSNLNAVHYHLETAKPALLFLTETQISSPSDTSYLSHPGYYIEHSFLPKSGVCVYIRDDISSRRLSNLEVCAFTTKKSPMVVYPRFEGTSLTISPSIEILGVNISSEVQFRYHLEGKAKLASKKLGVLNRARQYFSPEVVQSSSE